MKAVRSTIVASFAAVLLFVAPSLGQAAQGFIIDQTDLKAGPDDQFPTVLEVQSGAEVNVFGCLSGNTWCDVSFEQDRGWVSGQDLEVIFASKRVKVVEVTTVVVPVVTFEVASYWTQHYSSKPFFRDRDRFASINININGGGKAAPGSTGSGGQASITGSIKGKVTGEKAATGDQGATGGAAARAEANAKEKTGGATGATKGEANGEAAATGNNGCPAGQKNCKAQGNGAGANAMGKAASGDKAMGKPGTSNEVTGSIATGKKDQGATPMANDKGCKASMANCPKGGSGNGG